MRVIVQRVKEGIRPLPPDDQSTGIFKREVLMPVWEGREGLARRVHGGSEKTLHLFEVANCE